MIKNNIVLPIIGLVFIALSFTSCNQSKKKVDDSEVYYTDLTDEEKKQSDREYEALRLRGWFPKGIHYLSILDVTPQSGPLSQEHRTEVDSLRKFLGNYALNFDGMRGFNSGFFHYNYSFEDKANKDYSEYLHIMDVYATNPRIGPSSVEYGKRLIQKFKVLSFDPKTNVCVLVSTVNFLDNPIQLKEGDSETYRLDPYLLLYYSGIKFKLSRDPDNNLDLR